MAQEVHRLDLASYEFVEFPLVNSPQTVETRTTYDLLLEPLEQT